MIYGVVFSEIGKHHLIPEDSQDTLCGRFGGLHSDSEVRITSGVLEQKRHSRNFEMSFDWGVEVHFEYCVHCLRKSGFDVVSQKLAYSSHVTLKSVLKDYLNKKA